MEWFCDVRRKTTPLRPRRLFSSRQPRAGSALTVRPPTT
ncbi:hypothetical protein AKJ09_09601 [Labilithrix luteola]|uniref:Uncharacterized protein n=1 Tax=Labilithrix luteola TaxID=1391654 RepID=A0A0K1QB28_9BACT|nr:hypothetical protein AKJ09_09601 [Labilithrix luteola]